MEIQLQLVIKSENGEVRRIDDVVLIKRDALTPETLGLTIQESK